MPSSEPLKPSMSEKGGILGKWKHLIFKLLRRKFGENLRKTFKISVPQTPVSNFEKVHDLTYCF